MEFERYLSEALDLDSANAARMYDYYLGGTHNFPVDRERAEAVIAGYPGARLAARANRTFLASTVRWCLAHGISQFLDLGSGVPTAGNVHEVAHSIDPDARVAYVDFEPVAVAHGRQVIAETGQAATVTVTQADLREPSTVLRAPLVAGSLDFTEPVAVLMFAVLHFVDHAHGAARVVRGYLDEMAPGSVLAISHSSDDQDDLQLGAQMHATIAAYAGSATPLTLRSRSELREILDGLDIVEPGLVDVSDWPRPGMVPGPVAVYGAVAVVPDRPRLA